MRSRTLPGWLFIYLTVTTIPGAFAEDRTFSDLLARAEVQAAAGHRWAPPGDNVTETVADMMGLISSATPEQLMKLSTILEEPKASSDPSPREDVRPAIAAPAPPPRYSVPPDAQASFPDLRTELPPRSPPSGSPPSGSPAPGVSPSESPPARSTDTATNIPFQPVPRTIGPTSFVPGPRAKDLLARGQAAESQGDLSAARRLYASAAQQGEATAARSLGRLYDPAYLKQAAVGGIDPNPVLARHWYEQAVVLGDAEAGPLLKALALR